VRLGVRGIHPGPGVVPDPQVAQRDRDPGDLVVGGEPAAAVTLAVGQKPISRAGYLLANARRS